MFYIDCFKISFRLSLNNDSAVFSNFNRFVGRLKECDIRVLRNGFRLSLHWKKS